VSFRFIGGIMAPAAGSGVSNPAPRAPAPHIVERLYALGHAGPKAAHTRHGGLVTAK
jgi:hypothetical protein